MGKLHLGPLLVLLFCGLAAAPALADDLEGTYDAKGWNPMDGARYTGTVTVARTEDVYEVRWSVGATYVGTGVRVGDVLSVGYTDDEKSWFGVVGYRIGKDGTLTGSWCTLLGKKAGTETLTRRRVRKDGGS